VQDDRVELGDDEQLAVGVDEVPVPHARVGRVEVDGHSRALPDVAVAADGEQAVDEVLPVILERERKRVPAQPVRVGLQLVERR
jgi:hypothetical protein